MPINFNLGKALRETLTVKHVCGHVYKHPVHPKVSDAYRAEIAAGLAIQKCPDCLRIERQAATRERNRR